MSRVFNNIKTNVIYLNDITITNNNNMVTATGPNGLINLGATGSTGAIGTIGVSDGSIGSIGSTGIQGLIGYLDTSNISIESITGTNSLNANINTSLVTGIVHSLDFNTSQGFIKNIINLNSNSFNTLGSGVSLNVLAISIDSQDNVYVGGNFTTAGGASANRIAKWIPSGVNTGLWYPLGAGVNNQVNAIAIDSQDNVYIGGTFTTAGGTTINRIAKWIPSGVNTGLWYPLGAGVGTTNIQVLKVDSQDNLYAGGDFTTAGGASANRIAKWIPSGVNTGLWYPLGAGVGSTVQSIIIDFQDNLYVGGQFITAGGASANRIAKWIPSGVNTGLWYPLGAGVNAFVFSLAYNSTNNILYVGGLFTLAGGSSANRTAKWIPSGVNTGLWLPLGVGVNDYVYSLAHNSTDNTLYAGGSFLTAGGSSAYRIAKYIETGMTGNWETFSIGLNNNVSSNSLVLDKNKNLYIGGLFTKAGLTVTSYIVYLDTLNINKIQTTYLNSGTLNYSYNLTNNGESLQLCYIGNNQWTLI